MATRSATAKIMPLSTADVPVITPKLKTDLWSPVPKSFMVPSSWNANFGLAANTVTTIMKYNAALYHVREGETFICFFGSQNKWKQFACESSYICDIFNGVSFFSRTEIFHPSHETERVFQKVLFFHIPVL